MILKNKIFVIPAFLMPTKNDSVLKAKKERRTKSTSKKKIFLYRRKNKSEITVAAKEARQDINKITIFIFQKPCGLQERGP